ncbi:ATP-dependent DNA helicase [Limnohabitans sp. Rim47]|uniref:ATP-dependent DNA helicase n=2 Tax=Limnohabitans sp. Rim47 TaxID=1100721 RepID=UPI000309797A|nr:ATP-dependent DNA helicase [Limnohabitans sp. Rim47]
MSLLVQRVSETLSSNGALAQAVAGFQPRAGQTDMAMAVTQTLEQGGQLVVEAGTGVGKTYAYLVPVLLSGQRALVSTATKALQDQLFSRDIPRLVEVLGLPIRVALLKGRSNYLCLHRMEQARHSAESAQPGAQRALAKIETWSQATRTGDMAELTGLDERSSLWPLVTSTRDNCLGSSCPRYRACHVNLARKEAMASDVVVINHHLFFADMAVRESGVAELLPTVRVTVFDEAHQLNEIGVNFLGKQLSTVQLLELSRDVLATGLQLARGLVDWHALTDRLEKSSRDLRLAAGMHRGSVRLRWTETLPEGVEGSEWTPALQNVLQALAQLQNGLETVAELAPDFQRLLERACELSQKADLFSKVPDPEGVRWAEVSAQLRLIESPLDIAQAFSALTRPVQAPLVLDHEALDDEASDPESIQALMAGDPRHGSDPQATQGSGVGQRAWIFTSATLGDEPSLRWFTEPCGLTSAQVMQVSSPFDYAQQAALYVPDHLPKPGDPGHAGHVAQLVVEAVELLGGRTLVLTTTLNAMRAIGEYLQTRLDPAANVEVLVQGQSPKRRLMERFREGAGDGRAGCVLVASASFWEGFDVPGDALQLVVIDKLPFPPPGDPLFEARSQRVTREGRSAFADHALPEAAVALKQGAGRLIRSETDRGVLVVCDTRLTTMSYGRRLVRGLPEMRRLSGHAEFLSTLRQFTTDATSWTTS